MATELNNKESPILVLFREDLRLADNQALAAAANSGKPVVTALVLDTASLPHQKSGGASLWWLHYSIEALARSIEERGGKLILARAPHTVAVPQLVSATGAGTVYWNRRYHPLGMDCDAALKTSLRQSGIEAESFAGHLLHEPALVRTASGGPFRVYTPFWKALCALDGFGRPLPSPDTIPFWNGEIATENLADWRLLPAHPDWAGGLRETWTPGEAGANALLAEFLDVFLAGYSEARDVPGRRTTSRLSPHLAHGEISPRTIWYRAGDRHAGAHASDVEKFRKELAWREFSYHLLFHNRDLAARNFNPRFDSFPWQEADARLVAWRSGRTGYPIVDAGMRELWQTGWMHNRVRMICASFLVKHLMIDWRVGENWFADTLVDADPANNPASWQWVAGSGADAAPYFRIFNPILQGEKFDPQGIYVRRFVPELARLPDAYIHRPWEAPREALAKAGVALGPTYPEPVVDHQQARDRALDAFKSLGGAD